LVDAELVLPIHISVTVALSPPAFIDFESVTRQKASSIAHAVAAMITCFSIVNTLGVINQEPEHCKLCFALAHLAMFKSLRDHPPGGWRFHQPEIDWPQSATEFRGLGIDAVVDKIIKVREANRGRWPNLSLDPNFVQREVIAFTEPIVRKMKGGEAYLVPGELPQMPSASFQVARSFRKVAEVAGTVKRMAAGVGLLVDWLGDGLESVDIPIAEQRAKICATSGFDGSSCPFNQPAQGLQRLSGAAADDIKALMEARSELKLQTSYDDNLKTCQLCECNLKLKVLAPASHLAFKTSKEIREKFRTEWPACWMNEIGT